MSRKTAKKNALFNQTQELPNETHTTQFDNSNDENIIKIENYDALLQEKSQLEAKLDSLLDEVEQLRIQNEQLKSNSKPDQFGVFEKQIDDLRMENDKLILKISELSFEKTKLETENAQLKQRINQLQASMKSNTSSSSHPPCRRRQSDMYLNTKLANNGYSDWN